MKENIKNLCQSIGVAGLENQASAAAATVLKEYTPHVETDFMGNVIGWINKEKTELPLLLLDAHIDEIGMIVTYIDDRGYLKIGRCGGMDRRLLAAQEVTVHGKTDLIGVIGSKPPHLEHGDEAKKIPELDEMYIDIGMTKEQAQQVVSLGDRVTTNSDYHELLNDRISIKSLDDRAGVITILEALALLQGEDLPCRLAVLFSSQEEVGASGAKTAVYRIHPDVAIAIDVSFAWTSDAPENRCGKLEQGPMIGYAPSLNKKLSDELVRLAKEKNIPYQIEVMGAETGTNADVMYHSRDGVITGVVSIPLRYMHTPIETCSIADLENVSRLLAEYAKQLKL